MWEALTPRECKPRGEWCRATPLARDRGYPRLTERPATSRNAAKLARRQVHRKLNRAEWLSGPSSGDWQVLPSRRPRWSRHAVEAAIGCPACHPWEVRPARGQAAPAFTGLDWAIFYNQARTPLSRTQARLDGPAPICAGSALRNRRRTSCGAARQTVTGINHFHPAATLGSGDRSSDRRRKRGRNHGDCRLRRCGAASRVHHQRRRDGREERDGGKSGPVHDDAFQCSRVALGKAGASCVRTLACC